MVLYHGVAGEAGLQLEDLVQTHRLGLAELLLGHAYHELDGGVGVVLLVVVDEGRRLVGALQHGLQDRLLVGLGGPKTGGYYQEANKPVPEAAHSAGGHLGPGPNRKLGDLDGVPVDDRDLPADQVLVLAQLVDHPSEVLVAGKLLGTMEREDSLVS